MWTAQQAYYSAADSTNWKAEIPYYITSNAFYAGQVADCILAMAEHASGSITVVETGAGCAAFSHYLLHALARQASALPCGVVLMVTDISPRLVEYYAEHLGEVWPAPDPEQWAAGTLPPGVYVDWGIWAAPAPAMHALRSGAMIGPETKLPGPCLLVLNYVLDSLPSDGWRLYQDELYALRARASISSTPSGALNMASLDIEWEQEQVQDMTRLYEDEHYASLQDGARTATWLLQWYQEYCRARLAHDDWEVVPFAARDRRRAFSSSSSGSSSSSEGNSSCAASSASSYDEQSQPQPIGHAWEWQPGRSACVQLSVASLAMLERACAWSNAGCFVIAADKGMLGPDEAWGAGQPHVSYHGSLSTTPNLHSLELLATALGGQHSVAARGEADLHVGAYFLPSVWEPRVPLPSAVAEDADPHTTLAAAQAAWSSMAWPARDKASARPGWLRAALRTFQQGPAHFSPDDMYRMTRDIERPGRGPRDLRAAIAWCRLVRWDPNAVALVRRVLQLQLPDCRPSLRQEVWAGLACMWDMRAPWLPGSRDVAYDIAVLHEVCGEHESARAFYSASLTWWGEHPSTHQRLVTCALARLASWRDMHDGDIEEWLGHAEQGLHATMQLLRGFEGADWAAGMSMREITASMARTQSLQSEYEAVQADIQATQQQLAHAALRSSRGEIVSWDVPE